MNRVPGDRFAFTRSAAGILVVSRNRRLYVLEAQADKERTIDPDDIEATETIAAVYTTDDGATEVTQPLVSGVDGAWDVFYADPGDYDLYCPDDPIRPIKFWPAINNRHIGGTVLDVAERTSNFTVNSTEGAKSLDLPLNFNLDGETAFIVELTVPFWSDSGGTDGNCLILINQTSPSVVTRRSTSLLPGTTSIRPSLVVKKYIPAPAAGNYILGVSAQQFVASRTTTLSAATNNEIQLIAYKA